MNYEEKTISKKHIYSGSVVDVDLLTVLLPNGKEAKRDIVSHPGAAVVIALTEFGELYMVKQFRKPLEKDSLEIPAGKLDKDEEPIECAKRELKEETGLEAEKMKHIISVHSTPGFCDEILHIYLATGLKEGTACTDEDEFLTVYKFTVEMLIKKVLSHEITDAKTIIGILLADKIMKAEI